MAVGLESVSTTDSVLGFLFRLFGFAFGQYMTSDVVLLGNGQGIVDHPVQHQSCREEREKYTEDQG